MTRRSVHYEAALEDYLRSRGTPYVALDETRRVIFSGARIKSFDFLIYPASGPNLITDVKGRKFPYTSGSSHRYWENWVSRADLEGLTEWEHAFGAGYQAVLIFTYLLSGPEDRWPQGPVYPFRGKQYAFLSVGLAEYARQVRTRSSKWNTVPVPGKACREMVRPRADRLE